jgi:hypothetical protein
VLAEPRILAKLTLVRGMLGVTPIESNAGGGRGGVSLEGDNSVWKATTVMDSS